MSIESVTVRALEPRRDARGWLLKMLMRQHMPQRREFGEIYVTAANPGEVKGNHFHRRTTEWFCVVQGEGRLVTKDMESGEQREILMSAERPVTVEVAPRCAHAVQNVGSGLMLMLAYSDTPYDANDPDEQHVAVIEPRSASLRS